MKRILKYGLDLPPSGSGVVYVELRGFVKMRAFVNLGGRPTIFAEGNALHPMKTVPFLLVKENEEVPEQALYCGSAVFDSVLGRPFVLFCYLLVG